MLVCLKNIFLFLWKKDPYSLFENNELNNDNLEHVNEYGGRATIGNKTPMELIQFY